MLREEFLKVKREKNTLWSRIEILEDEVELGRGETDNFKHANSELIRVKTKKVKTKAIEEEAQILISKAGKINKFH